MCSVNNLNGPHDNVVCTTDIKATSPIWNILQEKLRNIDIKGKCMCGTNINNEIWCASFNKNDWKQVPGGVDNNNKKYISSIYSIFKSD